jgi:hypothetical protein
MRWCVPFLSLLSFYSSGIAHSEKEIDFDHECAGRKTELNSGSPPLKVTSAASSSPSPNTPLSPLPPPKPSSLNASTASSLASKPSPPPALSPPSLPPPVSAAALLAQWHSRTRSLLAKDRERNAPGQCSSRRRRSHRLNRVRFIKRCNPSALVSLAVLSLTSKDKPSKHRCSNNFRAPETRSPTHRRSLLRRLLCPEPSERQ